MGPQSSRGASSVLPDRDQDVFAQSRRSDATAGTGDMVCPSAASSCLQTWRPRCPLAMVLWLETRLPSCRIFHCDQWRHARRRGCCRRSTCAVPCRSDCPAMGAALPTGPRRVCLPVTAAFSHYRGLTPTSTFSSKIRECQRAGSAPEWHPAHFTRENRPVFIRTFWGST